MFKYMTVQETAKLWKLSERRVQKLCEGTGIEGVVRLSWVCLIPGAEKPMDKRTRAGKGSL